MLPSPEHADFTLKEVFEHTDPLPEQIERRHEIDRRTLQVCGGHDGQHGLAAAGRQRGHAPVEPERQALNAVVW